MKRLLAALTAGALGAALGGWLGWRGAGDLPTDAEARALVAAAVPDPPAEFVERYDVLFGHREAGPGAAVFGSDEYRTGYAVVSVNVPADGFGALAGRARAGFAAQGWAIEEYGELFAAVRDDWSVHAYPATRCTPEDTDACGSEVTARSGALGLQFERTPPAAVLPLAVTGWLLGLLAGWFGMGLLTIRHTGLLGTGLALMLPATVFVTLGLVVEPGFLWEPYMGELFRPFALLGGLCLVAVIGLSVVRRPVPATRD